MSIRAWTSTRKDPVTGQSNRQMNMQRFQHHSSCLRFSFAINKQHNLQLHAHKRPRGTGHKLCRGLHETTLNHGDAGRGNGSQSQGNAAVAVREAHCDISGCGKAFISAPAQGERQTIPASAKGRGMWLNPVNRCTHWRQRSHARKKLLHVYVQSFGLQYGRRCLSRCSSGLQKQDLPALRWEWERGPKRLGWRYPRAAGSTAAQNPVG